MSDPHCIQDLFGQPREFIRNTLHESILRERLLENVRGGVPVATAWSGMKTPELALECIAAILKQEVGEEHLLFVIASVE